MSKIDKVIFFQPNIGISGRMKPAKGRAKAISRTNHCRALLNSALSKAMESLFTTAKVERRPYQTYDYRTYRQKTAYQAVTVREVTGELAEDGLDFPATLSIARVALQQRVRSKRPRGYYYDPWDDDDYDGEEGRPKKETISQARMKNFFYLMDLFCGTFGVLFTPDGKNTHWRRSPVPRVAPRRMSYLGVSSLLLLHPALTALFLGQMRLAAFLSSTKAPATLRKKVSEKELRKALAAGDREACAKFLRKAKPHILRKERGLWAFAARTSARFDRLLDYLEEGGDALQLFGKDVPKNWKLDPNNLYGADFHDHGFNDYMGRQGNGDKKVQEALKTMQKAA